MDYVLPLAEVSASDIEHVGGKNASLGEMLQHLTKVGVAVPNGFAITTEAYKIFITQHHLDEKITRLLTSLNIHNLSALNKTSAKIRSLILANPFFPGFEQKVTSVLAKLNKSSVAVRSSATAEDLPEASFAGQQETYLNVKGIKNILIAIKKVYASLFTSRAIAYRYHHGIDQLKIAISVGIQPMVRSDKAASGVMFTLDTESGFDKVVLINASYGLGEALVQGQVNPDEFCVYKPALEKNKFSILERKLGEKALKMIYATRSHSQAFVKTISVPAHERQQFCINDADVQQLAKYALLIEKHYNKPMDIEWAKDGITGKIYILQARPETVRSRVQHQEIERYCLNKENKGKILATGVSVGQRIGAGKARVILDIKKIQDVKAGDIIVTDMTDPDWEPIMKKAAAIVTNRGGRTCHAAIVARELGIPAIVGCGNATKQIKNNEVVTVSCAESEIGHVYAGKIPFQINRISIKNMPNLPVKLCMNMGNPGKAFISQFLPNAGVGLARLEFIISGIGIHPNAVLNLKKLSKKVQQAIKNKTAAYKNPTEYYIEKLREGIAKIAAAFYPKQVIFRFSDFKSNEYANLLGGELFEEKEENPMIGFRGASRYKDERFRKCFELECKAFIRVRQEMGLTNAEVMVPFVRTVQELRDVLQVMSEFGLVRGDNQLKVYMMCEIPSNVILAKEFLSYVDGYSIGSNDLTQLVLGLDRDSNIIAHLFDERNAAVKYFLHQVIEECNKQKKYIGICGQGPSDHPDFAEWLMREGIQYMSLSPDTIVETWMELAKQINQKMDTQVEIE